jgi:predicted transglutaminase-like cysteine proteinase
VCARYGWACVGDAEVAEDVDDKALLALGRRINQSVNGQIDPAADNVVYGRDDYWSLPEDGRGDCEDYALLKKRELLAAGVSGERLLLAVVLTGRAEPHTVLVLRAPGGDYILDNLRGRVLRWDKTGYTFLKMQEPTSPGDWNAILLGPHASRS